MFARLTKSEYTPSSNYINTRKDKQSKTMACVVKSRQNRADEEVQVYNSTSHTNFLTEYSIFASMQLEKGGISLCSPTIHDVKKYIFIPRMHTILR